MDLTKVIATLKLLTELELHSYFEAKRSLKTAIKGLLSAFYPKEDFVQYERAARNLKGFKFPSVELYSEKLKQIIKNANCCLEENEKIVERERLDMFIKGLTFEQNNLYSLQQFSNLK